MKTCPACGLHVEDPYLYCREDGARLNGGGTLALGQRPTCSLNAEAEGSPFLEPEQSVEEQRVLSCQICGGEFPLTFTVCPVHDLPLTSQRVSRLRTPAQAATAVIEEPIAPAPVLAETMLPAEPVEANELDLENEIQIIERQPQEPDIASEPWTVGSKSRELRQRAGTLWQQITRHSPADHGRGHLTQLGFGLGASVESQHPGPPPGMRLAARVTAIALGLFAVAALYVFYRQLTRTPTRSARPASIQNSAAQAESPLIPTPSEAREYKEEPAPAADAPAAQGVVVPTPQKQTLPPTISNDTRAAKLNEPPPGRSTQATQPPQTVDPVPLPAGGRFDTQLVRMRSYKASSGYSYSLTFTLSERAGRPMKWERLSIVTHAASGATHTEMLPFQHWLAGSGALTFTVNVDMPGSSETDWRGRISCMSVGADESGRPMRASFGASVAP